MHVAERLVLARLDDITLALRRFERVTRELLDVARVERSLLLLLSKLGQLEWRLGFLDALRGRISLEKLATL